MKRQTLRRFVLVLAAGAALSACAGSQRTLPSAAELESHAYTTQQEYVIGAGDVLAVAVWQQPQISLAEITVRLDGQITMPLLDDVTAAGFTPSELKAHISERLEEYITAPHVTVVVRQVNSKNVYVLGEVRREGPIRLLGDMRVVDALSIAGGFDTFAAKRRIKIIRDMNGTGQVEFVFNYKDFIDGDNLDQNILLLPGDRIVVPEQSPFWR